MCEWSHVVNRDQEGTSRKEGGVPRRVRIVEDVDIAGVFAFAEGDDLDAKGLELPDQVVDVLRGTRAHLPVTVEMVRIQPDAQGLTLRH